MATGKTFQFNGKINRSIFREEFSKRFSKSNLSSSASQNALTLITQIESDSTIKDVRWVAYILATAMWEAKARVAVTTQAKNKKGQPLKDKNGQPILLEQKKWVVTMGPVDEVGYGRNRRYQDPVKVKELSDHSVRVTEQDGDQFIIHPSGKIKPINKNAEMGSPPGGARSATYSTDDGVEQIYYGRGYTQLTWWSNYATAGVSIGLGLDLLINPEKANDPKIAYSLMSYGMTTGKGFANGHKLSSYLSGAKTDYIGARRMINGQDKAMEIANIAKVFEEVITLSTAQ